MATMTQTWDRYQSPPIWDQYQSPETRDVDPGWHVYPRDQYEYDPYGETSAQPQPQPEHRMPRTDIAYLDYVYRMVQSGMTESDARAIADRTIPQPQPGQGYGQTGDGGRNRRRRGRSMRQTERGSTTTQYGGGTIYSQRNMATAVYRDSRSPIFRPGWGLDAVTQAQQWIDTQAKGVVTTPTTATPSTPAAPGYDPLALIRAGKSYGMQGLLGLFGPTVDEITAHERYNGGLIETLQAPGNPMARATYKSKGSPWFTLRLLPDGSALSPSVQAAQWIDAQRGNDAALIHHGLVDGRLPVRGAPALPFTPDQRLGFATVVPVRGPRTEALAHPIETPVTVPAVVLLSGDPGLTPTLM